MFVRWDELTVDAEEGRQLPGYRDPAVVRTFDAPEALDTRFYEVRAKTVINRVPEQSQVPFRWTINPYRGCTMFCVYCFARNTHTYLDFDYGRDFETKIIVKVNAPTLLRKELSATRWSGEHIAMGTNVDPYQRAEGRYRLMRGILEALRDFANPFSILTKGTLITRDIDLLRQAAEVTDVGTNFSVGCVDREFWRAIEPGTPAPARRLDAVRKLNEAGIPCGVLMAPIIPFISDTDEMMERTVKAISDAGATHISPIVLHLRKGGAREWWMTWLGKHRPDLVPRYRELYEDRAYSPKDFQRQVADRVHALATAYGIGRKTPSSARRIAEPPPEPEQLTLA